MPPPPKDVVLSKKEIGQRLRQVRKEKGITQVELAKTLGTFQTVVSAIERGGRGLTIQQVVKLARALGTTPDAILGQRSARPDDASRLNARLFRRLQRIQELPPTDRRVVLKVLDGLLARRSDNGQGDRTLQRASP